MSTSPDSSQPRAGRKEKAWYPLYHTPPEEFPMWVELRSRLSKYKPWIHVEEIRLGSGAYLLNNGKTLVYVSSAKISTKKGPLGWYFKEVNAKVYEKPNVIIAIGNHDIKKLEWALSKIF
jgi:hypothetical protein